MKHYEQPEMEVILFTQQDVVTLSADIGDGEKVDGDVGGWS